jgi:hypothetical protein
MRRMLFLLTSLGLFSGAIGCYVMHGVCDCDVQPPGAPTGYFGPYVVGQAPVAPAAAPVAPAVGPAGVAPPVIPVQPLRPEPLKEPKVGLNGTAEPPSNRIGG